MKANSETITIIVAEDNLGDFFLLKEYLLESCFNIALHHFESLENTIAFLKNNKKNISIIFSDLHLPDINNLDLIKKLLKHSENLPIVLMSSTPKEGLLAKSKALGVFNFLLKDQINTTLLEKNIRRALAYSNDHNLQRQ